MAQLTSRILGSESPVYPGTGAVPVCFQGLDFPFESVFIRDTAVQTLPAEHAQFHLRHIKPTAMFGSVVELQLLKDSPGLGWFEGLVQGRRSMGVQVVQHQPHYFSLWVGLIYQPLHLVAKVSHSASFRHRHGAILSGAL